MTTSNTELESHFAFGENWESYSRLINAEKVGEATSGLSGLVGPLQGRSFLDIGCGSGLSSLAALRLGAQSLVAIDIDPKSIETTERVLSQFAPNATWRTDTISVLSSGFRDLPEFDVVYSWGVLHHTGMMRDAIESAATKVKRGGQFAIAIYRKTPLCWAWRIEKWIYNHSPNFVQDLLFWPYKIAVSIFYLLKSHGRSAAKQNQRRGMDLDHDIRDWLGGYPYESATPAEIDAIVLPLGFRKVGQKLNPIRLWGVMGAGCSEYLYERS